MTATRLVIFNLSFWLIAAVLLFASSWQKAAGHYDVAIIRYIYLVVVGLIISGVLMLVYRSDWFVQVRYRLAWIGACSAAAALATAFLINPITYLMIGYNIHAVPWEIFSTGTLYFAFLFFIWSAIYFQLRGESILHAPEPVVAEPSAMFRVEKQGEIRQLQAGDLLCIRANGDYVDLVTAANTYLQKDTLARIEARLDPQKFRRVHRSTIVNTEKIESVAPKGGGSFEITLEGGETVTASRSYRAVVDEILPTG